MMKNLPAVHETWVQSVGQKSSPKKGMATHYSILSWRISWTEESGGLYIALGVSESGTRKLMLSLSLHFRAMEDGFIF